MRGDVECLGRVRLAILVTALSSLDPCQAGLQRDVLLEVLHGENVLARRYFYPGVHRMEPYRSTQPLVGSRLQETEALAQRVLIALALAFALTFTGLIALTFFTFATANVSGCSADGLLHFTELIVVRPPAA